MGWQLVREAEDYAPASLTWRELCALHTLANAAMDDTRLCPRSLEDRPDVMRRLRLKRSALYEVLSALCDKGALVQVERGRNGVQAVYAIAPFATVAHLKGPGNLDSTDDTSCGDPVDNHVDNPLKGPGFPDATGAPDTLKGPGLTAEGSGFDPLKGPGFPDTRGDYRDKKKPSIPYARAREAIRTAVPDASDAEIDEAIRIIKTRFNPRNTEKYVRGIIRRGDIGEHIPCGLGHGRHSESCRNRDCKKCAASWCEGRCHSRSTASTIRVRSA
jgi:hypothetical protein